MDMSSMAMSSGMAAMSTGMASMSSGMASMSSSMSMSMGPSATGSAAAQSTGKAMGGMGGMGSGSGCKISMLWNWTVIDACFIARSWRITSRGMFAGSCIGVILLVIALEFLRRTGKEYDRFIIRQHEQRTLSQSSNRISSGSDSPNSGKGFNNSSPPAACATPTPPFRPSVLQQIVRALLHMVQFGVAYFVMLLAMYYNGYIIICILIGAFIGSFIFNWENLKQGSGSKNDAMSTTVCCG